MHVSFFINIKLPDTKQNDAGLGLTLYICTKIVMILAKKNIIIGFYFSSWYAKNNFHTSYNSFTFRDNRINIWHRPEDMKFYFLIRVGYLDIDDSLIRRG